MIPVLVKPTLLRVRNRWAKRSSASLWVRDGIIALLTLAIAAGFYRGTLAVLEQTQTQLDFAYFHPSLVLGLVLTFLFAMLLVTNAVAAVGSFYMNKDLTTILASPIGPFSFFAGKCMQVLLGSSWMTMVFLIPIIAAFGSYYHGGPAFWSVAFCALIPYFAIPAAAATIIATLLIILLPAHRRAAAAGASLLVLYGLFLLLRSLSAGVEEARTIDMAGVLRLVSFLSVTNVSWMPSYLAAGAMGEVLEPTGIKITSHIVCLYSTAAAWLSSSYLVIRLGYHAAHNRAQTAADSVASGSRSRQKRAAAFLAFLSPGARAVAIKEYRTALRDFTQTMQALFLLGLCGFYLYLLGLQDLFQQAVPAAQQMSWRTFLIGTNLSLESFVITAMGTRLVFPAVSREAQAFWVLQSSPVPMRTILRTKYWCWLAPISLCTSTMFAAAVFMLHGSVMLVLFKIFSTLLLSIGLVGIAVGLGACFADFDWEHPTQLTTGFGALVYMVTGVIHVAVNLIIGASMAAFAFVHSSPLKTGDLRAWSVEGGGALMLLLLNAGAAWFALRLGERALRSRF